MGKKILFLIICYLPLSCVHDRHLVNESGVDHIDVWRNHPNHATQFSRIDDKGKIREIIATINENHQEPAYFYATLALHFVYKNGDTTVVGVNNDRIVFKGLTFKTSKPLGDFL